MKRDLLIILGLFCFALFSCENENEIKQSNFISAAVNGVETSFSVVIKDSTPNYIANNQNYFALSFSRDNTSQEYWSIIVSNVDIDNVELPLTIKGPNPDFTGQSPEFFTSIFDLNGGPYGKWIAGGSTFDNDISITITSFKGDVVKGTFEGAEFTNGQFQAKLERMDL